MRELDFTEKNLRNRWLGVNRLWSAIQGETKRYVKGRLERALQEEIRGVVGCERYERSEGRQGYRNGSYARELLTTYGYLEVPRVREGSYESQVLEKYRRRQRAVASAVTVPVIHDLITHRIVHEHHGYAHLISMHRGE